MSPRGVDPSVAVGTSVVDLPVRVASTSRGRVGYRDTGGPDGAGPPPLLMFTGFGATIDHWPPDLVDALATQRRVLLPDHAGVGLTDPLLSRLTVRAMAGQVAALLDSLDPGPVDVLGWSMGGMVAQSLVVRHPQRVRRLLLVAAAPGMRGADGPTPEALAALEGHDVSALLAVLFPGDPGAARAYATGVSRYRNRRPVPEDVRAAQGAAVRAWRDGEDADGSYVTDLRQPTLVVGGGRDPIDPRGNHELLTRLIPDAGSWIDPDAGHGVAFRAPVAFAARVATFLSEHRSSYNAAGPVTEVRDAPGRPDVVIASTPVVGHTQPMLEIASALVAGGHRVIFVGGSRFEAAALDRGAAFVGLEGAADYDHRTLASDRPARMALDPGLPRLAWDLAHLFGDAAPAQNAAVQKALLDTPDAVLVHDMLFLGAWPQLLGAPGVRPRRTVGVGVAPLMLPDAASTPFGPAPALPGMTQGAATAAANAALRSGLARAQQHLQRVFDAMGATHTVPSVLTGLSSVPDEFVQLTVPSFEFPRAELPSTFRFAGPMLPGPARKWTQPAWWPELTGRRVVVVTQGTVSNLDLTELVQPTLDALADRDVMVVAALGRPIAGAGLRVPNNARVTEFVPFGELFAHADLLVTNGGYGATHQALAAGLPLVVAGESEDKAMVAARIDAFGIGVNLRTQHPTADAVAGAVDLVLTDPRFGERAARIRGELAQCDAAESIRAVACGSVR